MDRSEQQQQQQHDAPGASPIEDLTQPAPLQAEDVKGGLVVAKDETITIAASSPRSPSSPADARILGWDHDFELRP